MSQIKVILFDIDDTLLSFQKCAKECMKKGFLAFGLPNYEEWMYDVFKSVNNDLWRQIENGVLSFEELKRVRWTTILKELDINFDGVEFEKYFRDQLFHSAIIEDGAVDVLEYLKGRYTLCVVSNGPYDQQINRLKISGLDKYFSFCFISGKVGFQKPTKQFFDHCFSVVKESLFLDLKPEEAMIIGDSMTADIIGGKEYGLKTCLYSSLSKDNIGSEDHRVNNLKEIKSFL